jgi:ferredoxin
MHVEIDLGVCRDQAQCVYAAPNVFSLTEEGRLACRLDADTYFVSEPIDPDAYADVHEAADVCPTQAITIVD